jgi:hypothetical protein
VRSIAEIAAQTLGRPLMLRVAASTERGAEGAAAPAPIPNAARPSQDGAEESRHELTERARKDPAVSRLLTEFGARVVDVRPLRPAAEDAGASPTIEENG